MMNRRTLLRSGLLGATGVIIGGTLGACGSRGSGGGSANGRLRMAMYGSNSRLALLEKAFAAYVKKHPGRAIRMDPASVESYIDKLATQVSGGNAPDIMGIFHHAVPEFARRKAFAPLDQYLGNAFKTDNFGEGIVELGAIDDRIQALSFGDNTHSMIFNLRWLEAARVSLPEPGYTWEDLLRIGRDVSRAMGTGKYGIEDRSTQFDQGWKVFLRQRGKHTFTPEGKLGFERSDLTDWLEYWDTLRREGAAPPGNVSAEAPGTFADSPLVKGFAATHLTYANAMASMQALTKDPLGITTLPMDPDRTGPGHVIRGSNWVGVYSRSADVAGAVDFLNFVFNDPEGAGILRAELGAPPNRELRAQLTFAGAEKKFIDYIDLVSKSYAEPGVPLSVEFPEGYSDVTQAFTTAAESMQFGRASVSEAVDRFFTEAERALRA